MSAYPKTLIHRPRPKVVSQTKLMQTHFTGGFPESMYQRSCNDFIRGHEDHVFTDTEYNVCECGQKRRVSCRCADCQMMHLKVLETTFEQRVEHELMRLHHKIATSIAT